MNTLNIFIFTNGCARRGLDVSRLMRYFEVNGHRIIDDLKMADYIIFSTCAFKKSKEEECFAHIEDLSRYKGELIIVDCLPEIVPEKFNRRFTGKFVSTKNLHEIDRYFTEFKIKFADVPDANFFPPNYNRSPYPFIRRVINKFELSKKFARRIVFFIKNRTSMLIDAFKNKSKAPAPSQAMLRIANGCVDRCSYCCIYRAVGKLRSKSPEQCIAEYKKLIDAGYRNILILADNVGAYGLDIETDFSRLLAGLSKADKNRDVIWEIQELHPRWAIKHQSEILKRIREGKIKKILCPIQSGSNKILKLMNRHHSIEEIAEVFDLIKKADENITLFTHVIVGFPNETEEDFYLTVDWLSRINLDEVTLYPYYDGEDTVASKMDGKIEESVIMERLKTAVTMLEGKGIKCFLEIEDSLSL